MSMEKTIERINEIARKAKTIGLTDEETEERNELRRQYIEAFKTSMKQQLNNIKFVDEDSKV